MIGLKQFPTLFKDAFASWLNHKAQRMAAALAYYTAFSMAPLLVIVIGVASIVFGQQAAQGELMGQIEGLIGAEGARYIQSLIEAAAQGHTNVVATLIGFIILLIGSTGAFVQLQDALNTVWDVPPKTGYNLLGYAWSHFLSFAMVLAIGFLLLVALVVSALLAAVDTYLQGLFPGARVIVYLLHMTGSFVVIMALFTLIYKFLPERLVGWHEAWVGATVTALLFVIGKHLIGLYLGHSTIGTTFGAAGSFAVLLIWIYYSAQIVLFGAEFIRAYTSHKLCS